MSTNAHAANIEKVAVGAHENFTRVVFHLDGATSIKQENTTNGQPLLILSDVTSAGPSTTFTKNHAPINGFIYTAEPSGTKIIFSTEGSVAAKSFYLPPDDYGGHRAVIDIRADKKAPSLTNQIRSGEQAKYTAPDRKTPQKLVDRTIITGSINKKATPKACAVTETILKRDPWDMSALIDHGLCKKKEGDLKEARSIFERILTFDPEFHRARLALAEVYTVQGETTLAKEAYEQVLLTEPPADVTKRIQKLLGDLR